MSEMKTGPYPNGPALMYVHARADIVSALDHGSAGVEMPKRERALARALLLLALDNLDAADLPLAIQAPSSTWPGESETGGRS